MGFTKKTFLFVLLALGALSCGKDDVVKRNDTLTRHFEMLSQDAVLASSLHEQGTSTVLKLYFSSEFQNANEQPSINWSHLPANTVAPVVVQSAARQTILGKISVNDMNFGKLTLIGPLVEWSLTLSSVRNQLLSLRLSSDSTVVEDLSVLQIYYPGKMLERWILPFEKLDFERTAFERLTIRSEKQANTVNVGFQFMGRLGPHEQKKFEDMLESMKADWLKMCGISLEFASTEHLSKIKNLPQLPMRVAVGPDLLGMVGKYTDSQTDILVLARWLLWTPEQARVKGAEIRWADLALKNYESKPSSHLQSVILVENLADLAVISHEIGHALLGPAHSDDSQNLMFSKPTQVNLSPEQCEQARAKVAKSF